MTSDSFSVSVSVLKMPLNESNVVARARRLLVCTIDAANFSDKMDIIFVAEMIEKIGRFVEKFKDVSVRTDCLFVVVCLTTVYSHRAPSNLGDMVSCDIT